MNNSKIAIEEVSLSIEQPSDSIELYREKESGLIRIIEAIERIVKTDEWSLLRSLFDSRIESLEKQLTSESLKSKLDDSEIYRLQGKLFEAKKYNLDKLAESSRVELSNIKKLTQPTER